MSRALLLIDVQKDYFAGGKHVLPGMDGLLGSVATLIEAFRAKGEHIVFVQHVTHDVDPSLPFAPYTVGAELSDGLQPEPHDLLITKSTPNAFFQTWLDAMLRGRCVTELVIAGAMTQTCIDSTARGALDFGYAVTVASDACVAGPIHWQDKTIPQEDVQQTFLAALALLMPVRSVADIIAPEPETLGPDDDPPPPAR